MRERINIGDLVYKAGHLDREMTGIVLGLDVNRFGHGFITVLREDGKITSWYAGTLRVINEAR